MVVATARAETANLAATLFLIVPLRLSAALARFGRDALGERPHFRMRGEVMVERLGNERLGGTARQRAGEAKLEVPVRIEPEGESRFGLARCGGVGTRQRHHFGRRLLRRGPGEAAPERALLLDHRRRLG